MARHAVIGRPWVVRAPGTPTREGCSELDQQRGARDDASLEPT